jgi:Notch-like protein
MRSILSATMLSLGWFAFSALGCTAGPGTGGTDDSSSGSSNGGDGVGGDAGGAMTGGAGGQAGQGGGSSCVSTPEQCDGIDNDCDAQVDEDCACTNGQTQTCYSGPMDSMGQGACIGGQQTCDLTGTWGACVGEVLPLMETCNNVDDDCNGQIDDMGMQSCGVGACTAVVLACENGKMPTCSPGSPSNELCDGLDNDCDQLVDETFPGKGSPCNTGLPGACNNGKTDCISADPACVPTTLPSMEKCNGIDDDCNGTVDDNIPGTGMPCGTGFPGVCNQGTYSCKFNVLDCHADTTASPEKCNGLDDDCDGVNDEGDPESGAVCMTGMPGACATGIIHCGGGMLKCVADALATVETCNGIDDNCDGVVDENNPGGDVECGCGGIYQCQSGALNCIGGPVTYFADDFSDNAAGWTMDTEWQIGTASAGCDDPSTDTSNSTDNGVAGVVLGGCMSIALHSDYYYLTSPAFNSANATAVFLQFQRWLNSDYTPYANNRIEVYDGASWVMIWQSGSTGYADTSWQKVTYDISGYKNANMRIRFGHNIGSSFAFSEGGWNIDDVLVASAGCP